ncbi:MAG: hypothetical protein GAK30_02079 [Paracidovorax wautersii]|uniref:Tripartite-type tricarboxylate transporter, receptor component TctC n=1 Tax=Paracidovorax wautersii TaxID=1177982 RepID=A0A7V8FNL4_9BURK|nr:MAG: hypothetical protein GAK30_02079 [Paracidovorax wautersii]
MNAPDLRGLVPAPVTPFTRDGAVDYPAIQRLGRWLGSFEGVKGLTVLGHAGEGTFLERDEQLKVIEAFRESVGDRLPIIAGITLLFSAATHVLARQVLANPPYDPATDFAPVARVGQAPLLLVVAPNLAPAKLGDVLAAARQQPGQWTAAIPAVGAPSHLATLLLAQQGRVQFTYVPYKGTQPALVDVAGGHVSLLMDSMISLLPMAKSGRVKPIAVTSRQRSALVPDIPTLRESDLPDFSYVPWYGVWAPKATPADRIAHLHDAINAAVAELGRSGAFASLGIEPVDESVDQFQRHIAADIAQGAALLNAAGFKPE